MSIGGEVVDAAIRSWAGGARRCGCTSRIAGAPGPARPPPDPTRHPHRNLPPSSAELLWLGDQRATPEPLDASATAGSTALTPWSRANAPVLGFFVPPAWLDDDRAAVTTAVRDWTRAMLPIELVRRLKTSPFVETNPAQVTARVRGEVVEIGVESAQEVTDVAIVSLPRGALASAAVAVVVPCTARIETGPQGPRHVTVGRVPVTAVEQPVQPLLRVRVTLASGDVVSRTWTWADLSR